MNVVMKIMRDNFSGGKQKLPGGPWIGPNIQEAINGQNSERTSHTRGERSTIGSNEDSTGKASTNRYANYTVQSFTNFKEIGSGRNALIYSAVCCSTGQRVAIKAYLRKGLTTIDLYRVKREIGLLRMLQHENIIRWLGHFEDQQCIFLVQEWASRGDLFEELKICGGTMPERRVVSQILLPLIAALQHMHSLGILHRDLKPENILLSSDGAIKVCDFGLAINVAMERPASRLGTLQYMAPEVVCRPMIRPRNMAMMEAYDEKVDIWACGVLVYELVMGRPPFEGSTDEGTTQQILHMELRQMPDSMSPPCQDFVRKVLRKDPSERISLAEMLRHPFIVLNSSHEQLQKVKRPMASALPSPRTPKNTVTTPNPKLVDKQLPIISWEVEKQNSPASQVPQRWEEAKCLKGKLLSPENEDDQGNLMKENGKQSGLQDSETGRTENKTSNVSITGKLSIEFLHPTDKTNEGKTKLIQGKGNCHTEPHSDAPLESIVMPSSKMTSLQRDSGEFLPKIPKVERADVKEYKTETVESSRKEQEVLTILTTSSTAEDTRSLDRSTNTISPNSLSKGSFFTSLLASVTRTPIYAPLTDDPKVSQLWSEEEILPPSLCSTLSSQSVLSVSDGERTSEKALKSGKNSPPWTEYATATSDISSSQDTSSSCNSSRTSSPRSSPISPYSPLELQNTEWLLHKPSSTTVFIGKVEMPTTFSSDGKNGSFPGVTEERKGLKPLKNIVCSHGSDSQRMSTERSKEGVSSSSEISSSGKKGVVNSAVHTTSPGRGIPTRPLLPDSQFPKTSPWLIGPTGNNTNLVSKHQEDKKCLKYEIEGEGGGGDDTETDKNEEVEQKRQGKDELGHVSEQNWPWLAGLLEALTPSTSDLMVHT